MAGKTTGIEKDLECPVCLDVFRNARHLSCLHTFCAECIEELSDGSMIVTCPECRETTRFNSATRAEGLKANIVVNRMVDTLRKKKSKEKLDGAESKKGVKGGNQQVCPGHAPCILRYFCKECCEPACSECVMETHKSHIGDVCDAGSLAEEKKVEMQARLKESETKLQAQRKLIKSLDAKCQRGIEIFSQTTADCRMSLDEHFSLLVARKQKFNEKVGRLKKNHEEHEKMRVSINELGRDLVEKAEANEINATFQQWSDALTGIPDISDPSELEAGEEEEAAIEELAEKCLGSLRKLTVLVTELKPTTKAVHNSSANSSTQFVPVVHGPVPVVNGPAQVNDSETNPKLKNIRVSGIPEKVGEDTTRLIINLVRDWLGIEIAEHDIDWSDRVGPPHRPSPGKPSRPRPILARLHSREKKREIMWETIKLKDSGISLYEDLSPEAYALKSEVYRHPKVVSAWTVDGTIYANICEPDGSTVRKCIPNRAALDLL